MSLFDGKFTQEDDEHGEQAAMDIDRKELIEQLAKDSGAFAVAKGSYEVRIEQGQFYFKNIEQLKAFAKAYQAAAPIDVPPDEYDIVVDTGDGIYHTAEVVHFQQEGSKRAIQARLAYAAPIDNVHALESHYDEGVSAALCAGRIDGKYRGEPMSDQDIRSYHAMRDSMQKHKLAIRALITGTQL
jgi:hypothetical protein